MCPINARIGTPSKEARKAFVFDVRPETLTAVLIVTVTGILCTVGEVAEPMLVGVTVQPILSCDVGTGALLGATMA